MIKQIIKIGVAMMALAGCTIHPAGEREERQAAISAGDRYKNASELPPLAENASPDEMVRYAMRSSADVEQKYWQWRAAIEQIPIDGTQQTVLALSLGTTLNRGQFAPDRTEFTAANDPMADIVLPGKLSAAARRSLENARAAGRRFREAEFELRRKVLAAYDDYALNAELIRLGERDVVLLKSTADITAAQSRAGMAAQRDVLKAGNEADLARNDLEALRAELPARRAVINALLNRAGANIAIPEALPAARPVAASDGELLERAARVNPELMAEKDEIRARYQEVRLAKLQYYPDFDLSAGTDLKGITQTLLGSITFPLVRYEALHAAVAQARANLSASEAMRRQTASDLGAQLIDVIATLRDADRQIDLLKHTILPRARQMVQLERTGYESGDGSLLDVLDGQRSLIDIERLAANLAVTRDKSLGEIEAIEAESF